MEPRTSAPGGSGGGPLSSTCVMDSPSLTSDRQSSACPSQGQAARSIFPGSVSRKLRVLSPPHRCLLRAAGAAGGLCPWRSSREQALRTGAHPSPEPMCRRAPRRASFARVRTGEFCGRRTRVSDCLGDAGSDQLHERGFFTAQFSNSCTRSPQQGAKLPVRSARFQGQHKTALECCDGSPGRPWPASLTTPLGPQPPP